MWKGTKLNLQLFLKSMIQDSSFLMKLAMEGSFECDNKLKRSCVVVA